MEEQLDVLDEQGEKTGEIQSYKEVHRVGLWHRTIHAWFLNSKGQLLLQKRSIKKQSNPGLWDISVAGHISAGQTSVEAAQRETEEEIGLMLPGSAYEYLFTVQGQGAEHNGTYINKEFQDVFLVRSNVVIEKLKIPSDEVEDAR
jgi:isopentenyldiphosphate isomerase